MQDDIQRTDAELDLGKIAAGAATATAVAGLAGTAEATSAALLPHVVVQLFLRGGADGLTLCVPFDEPNYQSRRTTTRVYAPGDTSPEAAGKNAIQLTPSTFDAFGNLVKTGFGLPPALAALKPLYDAPKQQLCFIHGCGSIDKTRSHFQQQDFMERGETSTSVGADGLGWLGRHLATSAPPLGGNGSLRALSFNNLGIRTFSGGNGVTPTLDPDTFQFPISGSLETNLEAMYTAHGGALDTAYDNDKNSVAKLSGVNWTPAPGAYPNSVLGSQFRRAFDVIRDIPDIEAISMDYDNINGQRWDSHGAQGVFDGTMKNLMEDLSATLAAFMADVDSLGPSGRKVIVLVCSEFGRTLQENDGLGTDHGRGGAVLLLGHGVNGGQVVTPGWQGLGDAFLEPADMTGDLPVNVDLRDVMSEIVTDCLGNTVANVFPDGAYTPTDHSLIF